MYFRNNRAAAEGKKEGLGEGKGERKRLGLAGVGEGRTEESKDWGRKALSLNLQSH